MPNIKAGGCCWLLLVACAEQVSRTPPDGGLDADGVSPDASHDDATNDTAEIPDGSFSQRILTLSEQLTRAGIECPERVWPGYSLRDYQVIFADRTRETAVLWNDLSSGFDGTPTLTAVESDNLPPDLRAPTIYAFGRFRGIPTLAVALDNLDASAAAGDGDGVWGPDFALSLILHEAFHFFGQYDQLGFVPPSEEMWPEPYPIDWQPPFLRDRVVFSLLDALVNQNSTAVSELSYWQDRLETEYPEERDRWLYKDVIEGSAQYAAQTGVILARLGCGAVEEAILEEARHVDPHNIELHETHPEVRDSYFIGMMTGFLLRERQTPNWHERVTAGEAPVEVLVDGVEFSDVHSAAEARLAEERFRARAETRNAEVAQTVDPLLEAFESPQIYRLALAWEWIDWTRGVFFDQQYVLVDYPGLGCMYPYTGDFVVPGAAEPVQVIGAPVLAWVATPCGDAFVVALIPKDESTLTSGALSYDSAQLDVANLDVEVRVDDAGRQWLCP